METGLTSREAEKLLKIYSKNEITTEEKTSVFSLFVAQFPTVLNGILFAAAIFSFIIKDYFDSLFILAILFLNGSVGFIQEYSAEKSLDKLKSYIKPLSRVIRDDKEIHI